MRLRLTWLVVLCVGCGAESEEPERTQPRTIVQEQRGGAADEPVANEGAERTPPRALDEARVSTRPPQQERTRAASLLNQGRTLAANGRHAEALAKFREGLAIQADNATLLCEAGWAAFHVQDDDAGPLLMRGAMLHQDRNKRAACFYNLGRLEERAAQDGGESHREAAARFYAQSLELRPNNQETQRRYRAASGQDYQNEYCLAAGTFADVPAYCAHLSEQYSADPYYDPRGCETRDLPAAEGDGPELVLVQMMGAYMLLTDYYLLMRTDAGLRPLALIGSDHDRDCAASSFEVQTIRWVEAEGRPTLRVQSTFSGQDACGLSAWDRCMSGDEDAAACEGLDDEVPRAEHSESVRLACEERGGRYRCTVGESFLNPSEPSVLLPAEGNWLEGDALDPHLRCVVL